jgi:hypothetical protein
METTYTVPAADGRRMDGVQPVVIGIAGSGALVASAERVVGPLG